MPRKPLAFTDDVTPVRTRVASGFVQLLQLGATVNVSLVNMVKVLVAHRLVLVYPYLLAYTYAQKR